MTGPTAANRRDPGPRAGTAIGRLIDEQLAEERARKASLEARGVSVITTSGALVTLLLGFGGLVQGNDDVALPALAEVMLVGGLAAFVAAAVAGLWSNAPLAYAEARADDLGLWLEPRLWEAEPVAGELRAAETRVEMLAAARARNDRKAAVVAGAIAAEVVAIALLAVAVGALLLEAS